MDIKEIKDKEKWENFISTNSPESFFQSWEWGEIIKRQNPISLGMEIKQNLFRLGIYDSNTLNGIAQVHKVEAKRGNFLHIRHGPIFTQISQKSYSCLLKYLEDFCRKNSISFVRISPLLQNNDTNNTFLQNFGFRDAPIHRMDGEICWVLDINRSEAEILSGMRKTTRYLIKQAQNLGVKIIKSSDISDLNGFLDLYHKTAKRQNFVMHKGISEEFKQLRTNDQIVLFKGYYRDELLASALIVFYNDQAIYHHSASIQQKIPVNYLLQWEAIKEAKKRNKKLYNFWGIAPDGNPRHPWIGLTLFKKGFGGRVVEYIHAKDKPFSIKYFKAFFIESIRKVKKGY